LPDFFWCGGTPERSGVLPFLQAFLNGVAEKWAAAAAFLWTEHGEITGKGGLWNTVFRGAEIMQIFEIYFELKY
jgi:hypothetical protein